ncbi:MAG TPA: hypothetical protein VGB78_09225 [Thermoplasmata archaeon]
MSGSNYERELKYLLECDGWYVIRSAGSLAVDLVAIEPENGHVLLLEVKSFKGDAFYISKSHRSREQHKQMLELSSKFNGHCSVFYALRKKGQGDFRLVHPHRLSKPYHWNQGETNGGQVHRTQKAL